MGSLPRDARLRTALRLAALAFWLASVLFLLVPRHASHSAPFSGVHAPQPKSPAARGL